MSEFAAIRISHGRRSPSLLSSCHGIQSKPFSFLFFFKWECIKFSVPLFFSWFGNVAAPSTALT